MRNSWSELRNLLRHPSRFRPVHIRRFGAMLFQAATLPFDRLRLDRLARVPNQTIKLPLTALSPEAAAQPTSQSER